MTAACKDRPAACTPVAYCERCARAEDPGHGAGATAGDRMRKLPRVVSCAFVSFQAFACQGQLWWKR